MRYFLEVSYKGTNYAGFQVQQNAITIQAEIESALQILFRMPFSLTGSSRTDSGVHALQNFFHFDADIEIKERFLYNINALVPADIAVKSLQPVAHDAHCRFLALSREYRYYIYTAKNPFHADRAWYYPYTLDLELLQQAADLILQNTDFTSFSKRNSQVFTHNCNILKSKWSLSDEGLIYNVQANRFLRGMVRGLVGTMLLVGRKKISLAQFHNIILAKDCSKANFATPAHGLFLCKVEYPPF